MERRTDSWLRPAVETNSFIYEIVTRHYPDLSEQARRISEREARSKLVDLYFDRDTFDYSKPGFLQSLELVGVIRDHANLAKA